MSKKTRKKSPKTSPGKATVSRPRAPAKKPPAKASKAVAKKSGKKSVKKTVKQAGSASPKASHSPPSKKLKLLAPRQPAPHPKPDVKPDVKPDTKAAVPVSRQAGLAEGARAPAFSLPRDGGHTVSLADYAGKKLVLFFYPRADTPGCTREAIDFTGLAAAFADSGTAVVGVSADPPKAQEAFRDKHQLAVPLISDETHQMLEAYGVWGEKSMYGRTFLGIVRTTVLVGADGKVIRIWRNVRVDGHGEEVLAATRSL